MRGTRMVWTAAAVAVLALTLTAIGLRADEPAAGARRFDSPEAAMTALMEALEANDDAALEALTGPGSADLVQSGKDPFVARGRKRVLKAAKEKLTFEDLDDGTKVPVLGFQDFPMPIPLAKADGKWYFDAAQGRDEILGRRIGRNELEVIDLMRSVVEAQAVYAAKDRDADGVLEYAQRFVSTSGTQDGLFWPDPENYTLETRSPLGALVAELGVDVAGRVAGTPFSGYVFKLLTAQGAFAPGGAYSFLQGANLTRGFGVLAVPAEYKGTGVKSFIISHRGRLFERDLGPNGLEVAKSITTFDPDSNWFKLGEP